jgi:hypothetical protein
MSIELALNSIDNYNKKDPTIENWEGTDYPKEFLESIKRTNWLEKIAPNASDALKIATRSQHIGRWEIPRDTYESSRIGYLTWRSDLAKYHASKTSEILQNLNFDTQTINRVQELNLKKGIKTDTEAQIIEDILCLVFLENHIDDFAPSQDEEVLTNIIQKTWKKMSELGRTEALKISYKPEILAFLKKALSL